MNVLLVPTMGDALGNLSKGLATINSSAYEYAMKVMGNLHSGTTAMGVWLAGVFLVLSVASSYESEGDYSSGSRASKSFMMIFLMYFVATAVIIAAPVIIGFIFTISNHTIQMLNASSSVINNPANDAPNWWGNPLNKILVYVVGWLVGYVAGIVVGVLIAIRTFEIYVLLILSPIPLSTIALKGQRQVAWSFLKLIGAYAIQGAVLVIIMTLYSKVVGNTDSSSTVLTMNIAYIIALVGSLRLGKFILGVGI